MKDLKDLLPEVEAHLPRVAVDVTVIRGGRVRISRVGGQFL